MHAHWYEIKLLLQHATGMSMDAIHIVVGVLLQLTIVFVFRKTVGHILPIIVVLAVAVANELNDVYVELWPSYGMQMGEALKDVIATMFIPTLLFLLVRYRPELFGSPDRNSSS